jgi:hypothetical protein
MLARHARALALRRSKKHSHDVCLPMSIPMSEGRELLRVLLGLVRAIEVEHNVDLKDHALCKTLRVYEASFASFDALYAGLDEMRPGAVQLRKKQSAEMMSWLRTLQSDLVTFVKKRES